MSNIEGVRVGVSVAEVKKLYLNKARWHDEQAKKYLDRLKVAVKESGEKQLDLSVSLEEEEFDSPKMSSSYYGNSTRDVVSTYRNEAKSHHDKARDAKYVASRIYGADDDVCVMGLSFWEGLGLTQFSD